MLLIKTKLGNSRINGIGLFADQFIPKGTLVQKFTPGIDLEISEEQVNSLPEPAKQQILHYAYKHKKTGKWILPADDTRFLNHSDTANLISTSEEEIDIAARDIQAGEELTVNYNDFDADSINKLKL